jgi:microcystin-dependent protein
MSDPFVGQIEIFGFGFPPKNWTFCQGQLLAISTNQALFALLGTAYGGNGTTTFGLPDLRSRLPIGTDMFTSGGQYPLGTMTGTETVTLLGPHIPAHTHQLKAAAGSGLTTNTTVPDGTVGLGVTQGIGSDNKPFNAFVYVKDAAPASVLDASAVGMAGGQQPHNNLMPSLAINACICLFGTFPSRN